MEGSPILLTDYPSLTPEELDEESHPDIEVRLATHPTTTGGGDCFPARKKEVEFPY